MPDGRETSKVNHKIALAFRLEAHSRLYRGGGVPSRAQCFPELKRQKLEIRELEAAESCKTKSWRGDSYPEKELQKYA